MQFTTRSVIVCCHSKVSAVTDGAAFLACISSMCLVQHFLMSTLFVYPVDHLFTAIPPFFYFSTNKSGVWFHWHSSSWLEGRVYQARGPNSA